MNTIWKINNAIRMNPSGLIIDVFYEIKVVFGDFFLNKRSSVRLTENPNSEEFIPFENLTEDIIIQWVKDKLGESTVEEIENSLKEKLLKEIKNKPTSGKFSEGLPWKK
jgi:hypothetical protein